MASTREKKSQNKRQFSELDETLTDFVIGNRITTNTLGNETLKLQANGSYEDFEWTVANASQNQVIGSNTDNRMKDAVDSAVINVEIRMHDAILTAMKEVVVPRVEMAVKSIRGSSGNEPNSVIQNPDRKDFTGNTENTPLSSASSRLYLNIEHHVHFMSLTTASDKPPECHAFTVSTISHIDD